MGGANTGEALGLGFNHRSERISPQGTLLLKMRTKNWGQSALLRAGRLARSSDFGRRYAARELRLDRLTKAI